MNLERNQRGFENGKFKDSYNNECSIKKSSAAMDDFIWLGIDKPKLTVFENENMGKYIETVLPKTWMADSRMHLSREQVAELRDVTQEDIEEFKTRGLVVAHETKDNVIEVSISNVDKKNGSPKFGDMIARNPKNHLDQWLVAEKYFKDNFEVA